MLFSLAGRKTLVFYVANGSGGFREKTLWRAWLPPLLSTSPNLLHLLPISLWQHCSPADNQAWISSDITLKRWLSPSLRKGEYLGVCVCVCVCVRWVWVLCERVCVCVCVCVQDWLDDEGGGEREARIREPSESWLGADTTPPHQGLNLLRDQTHLRWAGIIIGSIGQFLYYSHPSTCEIWTLVRHLRVHVSCFCSNLALFCYNRCCIGHWS